MVQPASRRRLLRLHAGLVAAVVLCSTAFVVEVLRALGGNTLSWAYVFEWPLLLAYAVYMWQRLVRDERRGATGPPPARAAATAADEDAEQDREAWNRYLAELHAADARRSRRGGGPTQ